MLHITCSPIPHPQSVILRDKEFEVPLLSGTVGGLEWGNPDRDADHGTVAINDRKDLAIAYQTDRSDLRPSSYSSSMKQVELALFRHEPGPPEYWIHSTTLLLGDVHADPLGALAMNSCARPDVISVGDRFFIAWTRTYDESLGPAFAAEPAVLECAWVIRQGAGFANVGGGLNGAGFALDQHASASALSGNGSVDAVSLRELGGNGNWTAGVVYKHQTISPSNVPGVRRFDLRFLTCTLSTSLQISNSAANVVASDVKFDGFDVGPGGVILPDLVSASLPSRCWLSYEEKLGTSSNGPECLIHLELLARDASGAWLPIPAASITFGSPASPLWRRRPNLSSSPVQNTGAEMVSIAFASARWSYDSDVVYEQWQYDGFQSRRVPSNASRAFPNAVNVDDQQPVPIHGSEQGVARRCYAARTGPPSQLLEYDVRLDRLTVLAETNVVLQRPAADYHHDPAERHPHYVPVIWEQLEDPLIGYRIRLRVR